MRFIPFLLLLFAGVAAHAQSRDAPAVDPLSWRADLVGAPSSVLTIGTFHLHDVATITDQAQLSPLLSRLLAFRPDTITYEGLSGEQCALLQAMPITFGRAADTYCGDPLDIATATGMSVFQAQERLAEVLPAFPAQPTATQRREIVRLFLAAHDRISALAQWLQLPLAERRNADGLTPAMVTYLDRATFVRNENYSVVAQLAARLGHVRVYAVDDHSSDSVLAAMPPACETGRRAMYQTPAFSAFDAQNRAMMAQLTDGPSILRQYRILNQPQTLARLLHALQRPALGGAGDCGRRYYAHLDTRNLRMVANIRSVIGSRPGARVLNIVGAQHKPFYDLYLGQSPDIEIVDAAIVLGAD